MSLGVAKIPPAADLTISFCDILKLIMDVCLLAHFDCKIPKVCIISLSVSDRNILSGDPRNLYINDGQCFRLLSFNGATIFEMVGVGDVQLIHVPTIKLHLKKWVLAAFTNSIIVSKKKKSAINRTGSRK